MSNSRLSKQGQVVSMQDIFTTAKTKPGRTNPSTGPHAARGLDIASLDSISIRSELIHRLQ